MQGNFDEIEALYNFVKPF